MKNTAVYAEIIALLFAVAVLAHVLASVDWPWAIAIGAAAAAILRVLVDRKRPAQR